MPTDYTISPRRYMKKMHVDARNRRIRFAEPQPMAETIAVHQGDLEVFDACRRHGPLPSPYAHQFAKPHNKSWPNFQYRMTLLFNGAKDTPPLLTRPPEQFRSFKARYQHLIYDVSKASKIMLQERGKRFVIRTDPFIHQLMNACVGASIELAFRALGIEYIHVDAILVRLRSTLDIRNRGKTLIPDQLFGARYKDGSYRFFWVEVDRATESITSNLLKGTFSKKLSGMLDVAADRHYKTHWSIPNLMFLIVTNNETHKLNLMAQLDKLTNDRKLKERFLFKTKTEFGINWTIPPVMKDLVTEPWASTEGPFDISKP